MVDSKIVFMDSLGRSFPFVLQDDVAGLYAWEGEVMGDEATGNGFKGKLDHSGRLWFFACDDPLHPTEMWLVRCEKVSNIEVQMIAMDIGTELGFIPMPNQLTIDKNDNVYFPCGTTQPYFVKVATGNDPDPDNWVVTPMDVSGLVANTTGCLCCTLNKDHTKIATTLWDNNGNIGTFTVLMTADLSEAVDWVGNEGSLPQFGQPFNMETDVSGSYNDGMFFIPNPNIGFGISIVSAHFEYNGFEVNYVADVTTEERVLEIHNQNNAVVGSGGNSILPLPGAIVTMERTKRCPDNPNRLYTYDVDTSVVPGYFTNRTQVDMACPQEKPKHHYTQKSPSLGTASATRKDIYVATGDQMTTGDVREINVRVPITTYQQRHEETDYRQIFVAGPREGYT